MGLRGEEVYAHWSMGSHGRAEGKAPEVPALVHGTGGLAPRLQALPGLKVGVFDDNNGKHLNSASCVPGTAPSFSNELTHLICIETL